MCDADSDERAPTNEGANQNPEEDSDEELKVQAKQRQLFAVGEGRRVVGGEEGQHAHDQRAVPPTSDSLPAASSR